MRTMAPNVAYNCINCGAHVEKYVVPSRLKVAPPKVCSRKCQGKALTGENHPQWRGGRTFRADGYIQVYVPDHPHANNKGCVLEHRLVVERAIGRILLPVEVVHHENDDGHDNRVENLRLFPNQAAHKKHHEERRERGQDGRYLPVGVAS